VFGIGGFDMTLYTFSAIAAIALIQHLIFMPAEVNLNCSDATD
jgi:hypothetical protein